MLPGSKYRNLASKLYEMMQNRLYGMSRVYKGTDRSYTCIFHASEKYVIPYLNVNDKREIGVQRVDFQSSSNVYFFNKTLVNLFSERSGRLLQERVIGININLFGRSHVCTCITRVPSSRDERAN